MAEGPAALRSSPRQPCRALGPPRPWACHPAHRAGLRGCRPPRPPSYPTAAASRPVRKLVFPSGKTRQNRQLPNADCQARFGSTPQDRRTAPRTSRPWGARPSRTRGRTLWIRSHSRRCPRPRTAESRRPSSECSARGEGHGARLPAIRRTRGASGRTPGTWRHRQRPRPPGARQGAARPAPGPGMRPAPARPAPRFRRCARPPGGACSRNRWSASVRLAPPPGPCTARPRRLPPPRTARNRRHRAPRRALRPR